VDRRSDQGFPVEGTMTVGGGLRLVEQVLRRQTLLRATWRAGAVFGLISHAMTGGERDFVSLSQLAADRYEVLVPAEPADRARSLIAPPTT
jgi:hypothetical protein